MKRLLMLGASHFQAHALRRARDLGHYVISCDYLPNNPGHKFSHESHNVSTTDKPALLALAKRLKIDGVLAYASDPAAPSAAFIATELGLPTNPLSAVEILTNKHLFRDFLSKNAFYAPRFAHATTLETALEKIKNLRFPLILKPVDSSGSKGVFRLDCAADLERHFLDSLKFSRAKALIIEEWMDFDGFQIAGDCFVVGGEVAFLGLANEHFDAQNPSAFVPVGESFPYYGGAARLVRREISRVFKLLGIKNGAFNLDIRVKNNEVRILEIGPRNGGNLIPQTIELCYGLDIVKAAIDAALGLDLGAFEAAAKNATPRGHFANLVVHSRESGRFLGFELGESIKNDVVFSEIFVQKGEIIGGFSGSDKTLGMVIFKSRGMEENLARMANPAGLFRLDLEKIAANLGLESLGGAANLKSNLGAKSAANPVANPTGGGAATAWRGAEDKEKILAFWGFSTKKSGAFFGGLDSPVFSQRKSLPTNTNPQICRIFARGRRGLNFRSRSLLPLNLPHHPDKSKARLSPLIVFIFASRRSDVGANPRVLAFAAWLWWFFAFLHKDSGFERPCLVEKPKTSQTHPKTQGNLPHSRIASEVLGLRKRANEADFSSVTPCEKTRNRTDVCEKAKCHLRMNLALRLGGGVRRIRHTPQKSQRRISVRFAATLRGVA